MTDSLLFSFYLKFFVPVSLKYQEKNQIEIASSKKPTRIKKKKLDEVEKIF